jgi:uncharacterized lipoprotein YehR (DUF1307 family)
MTKTTVVKRIAALVILSIMAMPLVGCKNKEEQKAEKADQVYKEWIKNHDFKHSEPKKSAF